MGIRGLFKRLPSRQQVHQPETFLKSDDKDLLKLIEKDPSTCSKRQSYGDMGVTFPLHVVLRRNSSKELADAVCEAAPGTILGALHDACQKQSDVQVIKYLVAKHPDGARATKSGNLPLHTACANKPSIKVIEFLLEAYPEGTGERNRAFKLPIHMALENGASLEVIKSLVEHDPESLEVADYDVTSIQFQKVWICHQAKFSYEPNRCGLPLHSACKYLANLQVIHYLISKHPDAARTKNKDGWLPVHYSCSRRAPLQTIQYLMTACPSSLYERTFHNYEYPMHLACGQICAKLDTVKYLMSRHTIACRETKPNAGLYLTYYDEASIGQAPIRVLHFLNQVCAKASQGYAYLSTEEDPYN